MAKLPAGCNVDSSPMSRFYQTLKDQSLTVPCSGFDFYVNAHETTVSLRCAHQIDMKTTVYSHMIEGSSKPECLAEYIVKTFREQCAMLHGGYASVGLIPYALAAPSNSFHPVAAKKYAVWGPELTDPLTVKAQLSDYWASGDLTVAIDLPAVQKAYAEMAPIWTYTAYSHGSHPVLTELSKLCPSLMTESATCPGRKCGRFGPIGQLIPHINDHHKWSREKIADWLETLDIDLTIKPPKEIE